MLPSPNTLACSEIVINLAWPFEHTTGLETNESLLSDRQTTVRDGNNERPALRASRKTALTVHRKQPKQQNNTLSWASRITHLKGPWSNDVAPSIVASRTTVQEAAVEQRQQQPGYLAGCNYSMQQISTRCTATSPLLWKSVSAKQKQTTVRRNWLTCHGATSVLFLCWLCPSWDRLNAAEAQRRSETERKECNASFCQVKTR